MILKLAKRIQDVKESPTLAITAKAKAMKAKGWDVIDFGAGEPDFDTPDNIKEAAIKAIKAGFTKYTAVGGTDELKDAVINKFKKDNGLDYTRDEILVSCGGKQSFFNLSLAFFEKGDEVIIPAPYWVSYPVMVAISGATPVILPAREENGFKITLDEFENAITSSTKAVVINSPSNPTGVAYMPEELKAIADVAVKKGVFIISDEIYEKLCYDNHPFISVASFSEEIKRQTIVLNGVSKTYSMTGWRIGYAAGPKELIKAMTNIQSQSTSNPTSISQKAAVEALNGPQEKVEEMRTEFDKRRKVIVHGLNAIKGIRCMLPPGSFYLFPNISRLLKKRFDEKVIKTSGDIAEFLLDEAEVAVVPGEAFGCDGHIRLSYATSMENIKEGLKRIEDAVKKLE
ncbi:MAG TPA: pyridoxal phosphate-dependent aminotransferase [Thermodesulfobacteriota bacterium]|nr:pyridoxal phosphate-dependent aminotransferase [Thermodesulfobacteriota bacterium]